MCGFVGYVSRTGVDGEHAPVDSMRRSLAHRGPDGGSSWSWENVALGHARLAIIDLVTGDQPMFGPADGTAVVFNGEIYNFREVRAELEAAGLAFRTRSDTEVLLLGYLHWGVEGLLERLNGMFAFALVDKTANTLVLARDRLGEKPLYVYEDGQCLAFASEIKALRTLPGFRSDLDEEALQCYLELGFIPAPWSIHRSVRKLEPGAYLVVDTRTGARKKSGTWWSVAEQAALRRERTADAAFLAELEHLIEDSVTRRLIADVPVGAFLSGGLDSSLVTYFASRAAPGLRTFHCRFKGTEFDESTYARMVAEVCRTEHVELDVSLADSAEILARGPAFFDEPFNDFSFVPTFITSRAIRGSVTVALSGDAGDELFLGYDQFRSFRPPSRLLRIASTAVHRIAPSSVKGTGRVEMLGSERSYWLGALSSLGLPRALQADVRRSLGIRSSFSFYDVIAQHRAEWRGNEQEQFRLLHLKYSLPDRMFVKVDRASMACSLEVRCPLADHRLLELVSTLSYDQLLEDGLKTLEKRLLARLFSPEFATRSKVGFGLPLNEVLAGQAAGVSTAPAVVPQRTKDVLLRRVRAPRRYERPGYTQLQHVLTLEQVLAACRSSAA